MKGMYWVTRSGDVVESMNQILAAVHEDWGACSTAQLDSALRELEKYGDVARVGGRYVVVERGDEEKGE